MKHPTTPNYKLKFVASESRFPDLLYHQYELIQRLLCHDYGYNLIHSNSILAILTPSNAILPIIQSDLSWYELCLIPHIIRLLRFDPHGYRPRLGGCLSRSIASASSSSNLNASGCSELSSSSSRYSSLAPSTARKSMSSSSSSSCRNVAAAVSSTSSFGSSEKERLRER